jgi:hypothetical protein
MILFFRIHEQQFQAAVEAVIGFVWPVWELSRMHVSCLVQHFLSDKYFLFWCKAKGFADGWNNINNGS